MHMSAKENNQAHPNDEGAERIDAIKQLIFGENMIEYDHKFEAVFKKLEEYHRDSETRLMQVNQQLINDLHEMKRNFEVQVQVLHQEINAHLAKIEDDKTDRHDFGRMLQTMAENLMK